MTEKDKANEAVECFKSGFNCCQAILSTYGLDYGIEKGTALRLAGVFGAGIARMGETCGAVTGALMVISLKHTMKKGEPDKIKEELFALAREFTEKFKTRNRTIMCRELLGYDLGKPEEFRIAKEKNLISTLCVKFVKDAAEILGEIINNETTDSHR